jgi:hypothetical protein
MSKKISEMSYEEKYEQFKKGIIELVQMNFNGERHQLEPIVFLGVKHDVLNHMLKNNKGDLEPFDSGCECEGCQANREMAKSIDMEAVKDKVHILPIMISKEIALGAHFAEVLGPTAIETAKELVNKKVHGVIEELNKIAYGAVQYTAHVTEAFIMEHKFTEKDQSLENMGLPNSLSQIEEQLKNGGVRSHPDAKEKAIIVLETMNFSEVVTFDMLRSDNYQELTNEFCHEHADTPQTGGYLTGLIHKHKIVN